MLPASRPKSQIRSLEAPRWAGRGARGADSLEGADGQALPPLQYLALFTGKCVCVCVLCEGCQWPSWMALLGEGGQGGQECQAR